MNNLTLAEVGENSKGFREISDGVSILHGNFQQADLKGGGTQCTGMAAVFLGTAWMKDVNLWTDKDVDQVLNQGDPFYRVQFEKTGRNVNKVHERYLEATEVRGSFQLDAETVIRIEPVEPTYMGIVRGSYGTHSMEKTIETIFEEKQHDKFILTMANFSFGIVFNENAFYLFNSHSCCAEGFLVDIGKSAILKINKKMASKWLQAFIEKYFRVNTENADMFTYSFCPIKGSLANEMVEGSPVSSVINSFIYPLVTIYPIFFMTYLILFT